MKIRKQHNGKLVPGQHIQNQPIGAFLSQNEIFQAAIQKDAQKYLNKPLIHGDLYDSAIREHIAISYTIDADGNSYTLHSRNRGSKTICFSPYLIALRDALLEDLE